MWNRWTPISNKLSGSCRNGRNSHRDRSLRKFEKQMKQKITLIINKINRAWKYGLDLWGITHEKKDKPGILPKLWCGKECILSIKYGRVTL